MSEGKFDMKSLEETVDMCGEYLFDKYGERAERYALHIGTEFAQEGDGETASIWLNIYLKLVQLRLQNTPRTLH
jgi:hypothetical protein